MLGYYQMLDKKMIKEKTFWSADNLQSFLPAENIDSRTKALAQFSSLPTRKDEDWRYLNFNALNKEKFATPAKTTPLLPTATPKLAGCHITVSHQGIVAANLPNGVTITPISSVNADLDTANPFKQLNAALFHYEIGRAHV